MDIFHHCASSFSGHECLIIQGDNFSTLFHKLVDYKLESTLNKLLNIAAFWKAYFAVFLSFVTSRLLLQTDILMISPLGAEATAAFAVPGRLMVIDTIIAFALGPVISVAVSRESQSQKKHAVIRSSLGFTFVLSLFLVCIGFLLYPIAVDHFVADSRTKSLALDAVFWMTLSIPIKLLVFITTMCLFACEQGHRISIIYVVTLTANALLNWLLIYHLNFGFSGSYIATVIVSVLELAWLLWLTARLTGGWPFSRFQWQWLQKIIQQAGAEWGRLVSWQAEGVVILALLASKMEWFPIFSAFGVISEFSALLLMPLIALMRTTAMQIAAAYPAGQLKEIWQNLKPICLIVCAITTVLGLSLVFLSHSLGRYAYHLEGERLLWWNAFILLYGLTLPIFAYNHLIRGCYQACGKFARIAAIEISLTWIIFIPLLWLALRYWAPFLFFFAYVVKEAIIAIWLRYGISKVSYVQPSHLAQASN